MLAADVGCRQWLHKCVEQAPEGATWLLSYG